MRYILREQELSSVLPVQNDFLVTCTSRYVHLISDKIDISQRKLINNADMSEATELIKLIKQKKPSKVIGLGSGKAIDVTKFATAQTKTYFVAIPTCLSTNCIFTDKSTLFTEGEKITHKSKVPNKIIYDWNIISQNNFMNICGLVELMSSTTALNDWLIVSNNNEASINNNVFNGATQIIIETEQLLTNHKDYNLKEQLGLLKKSGDLVVEFGSGRPVSGSEHILAAEIESYYRCPHGIVLYITIPICIKLQEERGYPIERKSIFSNLRENSYFNNYITQNMDKEMLLKLLKDVKPRDDRFTVINIITQSLLAQKAAEVLNDIFK